MTWPNATDYNAAVQNPRLCFRDDDLRQGQAVGDLFGLPRPHSGNFADVYQMRNGDGQSWAVKCFTRPVAGLQPRYHAISEHLRHSQRAFMVEFHFLAEGIRIHGQWHPLVKMRWVEGFRLNEFIREQLNKPVLLDRLAQLWIRLAQELREARMAHGDLQHGNVLMVPGSKSSSLALKLIDYDGMYVPALADRPSGEIGHANYQHPQRLREGGYHPHMDRFAHLLIYTALRCLRVGGEELWQRYDNMENLLFREEDFRQPDKSRLLRELWDMKDRNTRYIVGHLLLASQRSLPRVPALDELLDESGIRPLSDHEEGRINDLLDGDAHGLLAEKAKSHAAVRRATAVVAAPTVETTALADTQSIALKTLPGETPVPAQRTGETPVPPVLPVPPVPPVPPTRRRTWAEIEQDAQPPPLPAPPKKPFDLATLTDPLASILSRPGWLAALSAIALVSFLVVNVLVWSSVKQPATEEAAVRLPLLPDKGEEKTNPVPVPVPESKSGTGTGTRTGTGDAAPTGQNNQPKTQNPKPKTQNPKPKTQNPKPKTQNPKPKTQNPKPKTESGRREIVHFPTVDHMKLTGTLYHGGKGKKGMTVLMLHDLGRNRNTPGWRRLAEALQTEGHTVLTFDFRGHGDSKQVSAAFWSNPVNKRLPDYWAAKPPQKQIKKLEAERLPTKYMPWLIEDIAAARTFLDLRHDKADGPVNTFNLVVIGAGQASALGSLWLATEGLRFNAAEVGDRIVLKPPEKLSVRQAVWIGMENPLKLSPVVVYNWLREAHAKPEVPITFIYGEDDPDAVNLLARPIREKLGKKRVIPKTRLSGQELLDEDAGTASLIQRYLVQMLQKLPPEGWLPRKIKKLHSYWVLPVSESSEVGLFITAKKPGQETLAAIPMRQMGIPVDGAPEVSGFFQKLSKP